LVQNRECVRRKLSSSVNFTFPLVVIVAYVLTTAACGGGAAAGDSPKARLNTQVTSTGNPLVAQYTVTLPAQATVAVQFGSTPSYGLMTSPQAAPANGGGTSVLVAGMKQNAAYHMRAMVTFGDGTQQFDSDQTFRTGSIPPQRMPSITVTTPIPSRSQPGIELLSLTPTTLNQLLCLAADHAGNVIWYYDYDPSLGVPQPIKLLPNGHMLVVLYSSGLPYGGTVREIDLAGNIVHEITFTSLNQKLQAAGYNLNLYSIDHDFWTLANGHLLLIVSNTRVYTDLPGYPGQTTVYGNAIVDLDANYNVVWVWDAFDHLDVNRHPIFFPDWTHANALTYSADDGNLLLSLRHQSWVIKIDYQNGNASGDILWRLGDGGDFVLNSEGSDWFYAQHDANIASPNTTGDIKIALFDNGDYRQGNTSDFIKNATACAPGDAPLCYSTSALFDVNENTMAANRMWSDKLPYSWWGGVTRLLPNSNIFLDETAPVDLAPAGSRVQEVTQDATPAVVWQMLINGQDSYRTIHLPSLYPEVQW
jgi:arylsulfate sulfotransferase